MNFVVSAPILTSKLPVPLPHLLFTLSLITAILYNTTFQNIKQIVFRLFRTLLPGLWLRLPNSVTSPIFSNLYIGLKSTERIEYKLLSLTDKALATAQPTYLHSLISVQPPRATRSSSVVTLSRPPTSSSLRITNRSFRYAYHHLWNQLPVSFRQPCIKHPADDVTLSNSPPTC